MVALEMCMEMNCTFLGLKITLVEVEFTLLHSLQSHFGREAPGHVLVRTNCMLISN